MEMQEQQTGGAKATGGFISYYGNKTIHTFTSLHLEILM